MEEIELKLNHKNTGSFFINEKGETIAEMVFTISGKELTVHHTEVSEKSEGKGIGKKLLSAMVDYAREHQMRIIPLCSYVYAQFKKHADEYADVWKK